MGVNYNPKIVTDSLILFLDLRNTKCYSGSGTNVTDLIQSVSFTLRDPSYYTFNSNGTIQFTRTTSPTAKDGGGLLTTQSVGAALTGNLAVSTFLYTDHTWEVWIKINDRTPGNYDATEGSSAIAVYPGYHAGFYYTSSAVSYAIWNGITSPVTCASWTLGTSGTQVIQGNWHQIAVTRSGSTFTPYVNGINLGTGSTNTPSNTSIQTNSWLALGKAFDNDAGVGSYNYYAKNTISQMKMYNRALSAEEIQQNFNASRGRFEI